MDKAEGFLNKKGIYSLDTKRRFKEVLEWMTEFALEQSKSEGEGKEFEINFGGHCLAVIAIKDNKPRVFGAMDGFGDGIMSDRIIITEKENP